MIKVLYHLLQKFFFLHITILFKTCLTVNYVMKIKY